VISSLAYPNLLVTKMLGCCMAHALPNGSFHDDGYGVICN
jgi:hypothetical protein